MLLILKVTQDNNYSFEISMHFDLELELNPQIRQLLVEKEMALVFAS